MALDYGSGVSRTLSAIERQFGAVVWQKGKPPLDSELNLMSQVDWERFQQAVRSVMPSGFLMDPTRAEFDFAFSPNWINHFRFGVPRTPTAAPLNGTEKQPVVWANVNGWVLPLAGTDVTAEGDLSNVVKLYPPPASDDRVDFVFLEAWQTVVQPNPSTANKPTASTLWKYGNTKYGGTNISDDLEDPEIGFETTKRIQVQYRIRVFGSGVGLGQGVALDVYPDGLGDPNILGQGAATSPVAGMQWANMREALGDPSLWRSGDGDPNNALGTVDGYTYALPICAVFRRNSNTYVAVKQAGNPNQNGAFLRSPGAGHLADPLDGAVALGVATLTSAITPDTGVAADALVNVTGLNGSGLEDTFLVLSSTFLVLDDEIVGISAVDLVNNRITIPAGGRGRWGTAATGHAAGTVVKFFNSRPDGKFADEVHPDDILDLRRAVNPGDWDYTRLLAHNVAALAKGTLKTAWKKSNPGDTEGPVVHEVDELYAANEQHPNHTDPVDGPDGIRTVWSDAATPQPDVTVLLDNEATRDANGMIGFTNPTFDATVQWDVGADLKPIGFMNTGNGGQAGWTNGSSIHLFIGGTTGAEGARETFRSGTARAVRFLMPREYWRSGYPIVDPKNGNQHPVALRFLGEKAHHAPPSALNDTDKTKHPGPMYPWRESNFERPFIALGGLLESTLRKNLNVNALQTIGVAPSQYEIDFAAVGLDFDAVGVFRGASVEDIDPANVSVPLFRGTRTLFDMLTDGGRDRTGASSEVYLLTYGDISGVNNNGAFKVVGAGLSGYTTKKAANASSLVVEALSSDFTGWSNPASGNTITVDFRSQEHSADDISTFQTKVADLVIVLTDIGGDGDDSHPWNKDSLGDGDAYDLTLAIDAGNANKRVAPSKAVLSLTLFYHPGRSGMARVPDEIVRFAMRGGAEETIGTYLRRSPSTLDTTFSAIGTATDETYWDPIHVQTWNRLPALGWHAPDAPAYGGSVVGFTEQDREHELFVDRGSKTLVFRPFRNRDMTLKALTHATLPAGQCLLGSYTYPDLTAKDALQILTGDDGAPQATTGKRMGFEVPREFMPRFGRQDIPYYKLKSGETPDENGFLPGINHLFTDVTDLTNPVFNIIGGEKNDGGTEVNPLFFQTRPTEIAYGAALSNFGPAQVGTYGARKTTDIDPNTGQAAKDVIAALAAVNSSDLGRGLKGIQLPPHVGIVRLYGVYEYEDYTNQGGTSFKANRYQMENGAAKNLLREDADQQTLFILRDGAKDLTESLGDHTYIVPSNVLDLTRIPAAPGKHAGYVAGSKFEDFDYVVEATVFFFAKDWINGNNIVLCRKVNGGGGTNTDGTDPELENVPMCIPCPAGLNDHFYVAYNRTVYQGDPFMTRDGGTRQTADYEARYGQLTPSQAWLLRTAVQQYDANGDFVPEMDNERGFEVLASLDFYTTLGTGKVGGAMFPGTVLDVGHVQDAALAASRMPETEDAITWQVNPRAFTEGQKENTSRAQATVEILDPLSLNNANLLGDAFTLTLSLLDGTQVKLWFAQPTFNATIIGAGGAVEDIVPVLTHEEEDNRVFAVTGGNFGSVSPSQGGIYKEILLTDAVYPEVDGVSIDESWVVKVTPKAKYLNDLGSVIFTGYVSNNEEITVQAHYTAGWPAFQPYPDLQGGNVRILAGIDVPDLPQGTGTSYNLNWPGVDPALPTPVAVTPKNGFPEGLKVYAFVSALDTITISVTNPMPFNINALVTDFWVAVLKDVTPANYTIDLSDVDLVVELTQMRPSKQQVADALVEIVNAHSELQRTVKAFNNGTPKVVLEAVPVGAEGNQIRVSTGKDDLAVIAGTANVSPLEDTLKLLVPTPATKAVGANVTSTFLMGGVDIPVNAGNGTNQIALTGMTERLPLGVLLQDSDFLCENPLGDDASAMNSHPSGLRPIQSLMLLTSGGEEYSRFFGEPGALVALADVQVAPYSWAAWTDAAPDGATRKFRIYRGGGAAFLLSGEFPGGPIDWVSESFPAALKPVVKGGVLACRAMLVRNFPEAALPTDGPVKVSDGDEIQMVVLTYGHLGNGQTAGQGLTLDGIISPSGYGEGYAAADRYRCMGRPMLKGYSREIPDPSQVTLAVYPETQRGS